jgi:hypothetical protein
MFQEKQQIDFPSSLRVQVKRRGALGVMIEETRKQLTGHDLG